MKLGVDGKVFIAIKVGENVGTFCLVDNQQQLDKTISFHLFFLKEYNEIVDNKSFIFNICIASH